MINIKKIYVCFILLAFVVSISFSQNKYLEDIQKFETYLCNYHPLVLKDEKIKNIVVSKISKLKNNNSLSDMDLFWHFKEITSILHDKHTSILSDPTLFNYYPIYFGSFGNDYYVIKIDKTNSAFLYGKLIKINDLSISDIEKRLEKIIGFETTSSIKNDTAYLLSNYDALKYTGVVNKAEAVFAFEINGKIKKLVLKSGSYYDTRFNESVKNENEPEFMSNLKKTLYWNYYKNNNLMYLRINRMNYDYRLADMVDENVVEVFKGKKDFNMNNPKEAYYAIGIKEEFDNFARDMEDLFKEIKDKKASKLVIDIRNNKGGFSFWEPLVNKIKNSSFNTKKSLFLLVDKNTFSSAVQFAAFIKQETNIVIIGEIPSNFLNSYGAVIKANFSNLPFRAGISTNYHDKYIGIIKPDIYLYENIDDYKKGKDSYMEYINKNFK